MKRQDRTDRILIGTALAILLLVGTAYYFDSWMWGGMRSRGEKIGVITSRSGDVRLKFEDDLKWQKGSAGQDLSYNDAIYAGSDSQAELLVGQSKMTVTENSLIVLRRDRDISFLNLNYGTLFGKVAKNDKIVIDTGDGKPIEFTSGRDTQIVLRRKDGKTQLDVTSGEATVRIGDKLVKVNSSQRLVLGDKTPAELQPNHLRIVRPLKDQVLVSDDPVKLEFQWEWENGRAATPADRFTLEFAAQPSFKKLHMFKSVQGALTTTMTASQSLSLYYRIKGPGGEISAVEQVNYVRLQKPLIVRPLAGEHLPARQDGKAMVEMEFRRPADASLWYQIAADAQFSQILANQNTTELKVSQELPVGQYYLRARADSGGNRLTGWTDTHAFTIDQPVPILPLANRHLPTHVLIPNRDYPSKLYGASASVVEAFLAEHGFLNSFFSLKADEFEQVRVQLDSGAKPLYTQNTQAWPTQELAPARYAYRYQTTKTGYQPSEWSTPRKLHIEMEPPKPVGEVAYGNPSEQGMRSAAWDFTPLLFAHSYDVEVSPTPGFQEPLELRSEIPHAETELPEGEYFWRARARDIHGRIISAFSKPYKMKSMPQKVPQFLAKNEPPQRRPAQIDTTRTKAERIREKPFARNGWWAWLGSGENYVDYKQSGTQIQGVDVHHYQGGSQYFEGGFIGGSGVGGVLTYKNTPGVLEIPGHPIYPNNFRWTTVSVEGLTRKTSSFSIWDAPINYGFRVGIQQHTIPFLVPDPADSFTNQSLDLANNQMTTVSAGMQADWSIRRWTYYWLMRYQVPFESSAAGASEFTITPLFGFDGSVGTSYNITQQAKVGLFWYGQMHQFDFKYQGTLADQGSQSLFYSSFDLRLGVDF